jgi:hypothetical protein
VRGSFTHTQHHRQTPTNWGIGRCPGVLRMGGWVEAPVLTSLGAIAHPRLSKIAHSDHSPHAAPVGEMARGAIVFEHARRMGLKASCRSGIERKFAQDDVGRFETMLRDEPAKYWRSPELQQQLPGPADGGAVRV